MPMLEPRLQQPFFDAADLLCKLDEFPAGEQADADDPVEFEIRMIRKALGPKLPLILKAVGVSMPETRDDLDELIGYLTGSVC